ncbi:MAG: hypothetical protein ACREV9_12820 [Burkholderiales bacterium]
MASKKTATKQAGKTPAWEWVIAGFGLLLVTAAIALLLHEAIREPKSAPDIALDAAAPVKVRSGWHVTITATNRGGKTAAKLAILAELRDKNSKAVESAELTFDYLAPRSTRQGGVYFQNDPGQFELALTAKSYVAP